MARSCPVCLAPEPKTIDLSVALWIWPCVRSSAHWSSLKRQHVKKHRDRCLVGERRQAVEDDLVRMAGVGA
jgi:hypothetical protein